jgi:haloalkane dehalogenase
VNALAFSVPRELFDVEYRYVDLDRTRIHYVDEGLGDTLVLLHGNPTWSFLYRKIITALRGSFRCAALDYPGCGMSSTPADYRYTPREHGLVLERLIDHLGLDDLTLMVQDLGGPIGLGFACSRPERVKRLVIGNSFAWPLEGEMRYQVFSWVMGGGIGRALTWAFNFVPRFFLSHGMGTQVPKQVLDAYLAPWRRRAA